MSGTKVDKEFEAIRTCLNALEPLEGPQRDFALQMVLSRLGVTAPFKAVTPPMSAWSAWEMKGSSSVQIQ